MKDSREENCGRVDVQNLMQAHQAAEETYKAAHLLSCGGVYISRELEAPALPYYHYVSLPNNSKSILVLKNLKIHKVMKEESKNFLLPENSEELQPVEQSPVSKKIIKEELN